MNTSFGFFPYNAINYKAAQASLDRRAERGWALRQVYIGCIARFQRAEHPKHFVDLDIRNAIGDTDQDYLQLCGDAGWELVRQLRGMLLFRAAPGADPVPIQTDGELEWERFWEKYRPRLWASLLTFACVALLAAVFALPSRQNWTARLALNSSLAYLAYFLVALAYLILEWIHSQWYLARCRRSGRVERPGAVCTFLDAIARLLTFMLCLILLLVFAEYAGFGRTVKLEWYRMHDEYAATVEACREWPVVLASDLGLPNGQDSRHLEGRRSVLMDAIEYRELTHGEDPEQPLHILTTERYACLSEGLAKWVLHQRQQETRKGAFLWGELAWEPAPGLGFDECYTTQAGGYLLFRQGRVVALVGCTGIDLTDPQAVQAVRARVLSST